MAIPLNTSPQLYTKEVQDIYARTNFQNLVNYFLAQNQLLNFNFFEVNITAATTSNQALNHGLAYAPKDIILTQLTGPGNIDFLFGAFNTTNIYYTTTGACRARFFVGTYWKDKSIITPKSTDAEILGAPGSGAPGSVWYNGSGPPPTTLGVDGDYYLDDGTGNVYAKTGGTWL